MPMERRDPVSKARLFIPTTSERALVKSQRQLSKSLEEVDSLKKELQKLIGEVKRTQ
ncbi:hypothetical protein BSP14_088 [Bacillus phage BSP14]|nr:hypothetical protein BSP14_088 [Bacillus phage BSP14]